MGQGRPPGTTVFVGNISYDTTEEELKEVFSQVGTVVSFRLLYDQNTGRAKGYGFCEYEDKETAMSARRNLNGTVVNGRPLRVDLTDSDKQFAAANGLALPNNNNSNNNNSNNNNNNQQAQSHHHHHQHHPHQLGQQLGHPQQHPHHHPHQQQFHSLKKDSMSALGGGGLGLGGVGSAVAGLVGGPPGGAGGPGLGAGGGPGPGLGVGGGPGLGGAGGPGLSGGGLVGSGAVGGGPAGPMLPSVLANANPSMAFMSLAEIHQTMVHLKKAVVQHPNEMRELLTANPRLAHAILQGQIMLGMIPPPLMPPVPGVAVPPGANAGGVNNNNNSSNNSNNNNMNNTVNNNSNNSNNNNNNPQNATVNQPPPPMMPQDPTGGGPLAVPSPAPPPPPQVPPQAQPAPLPNQAHPPLVQVQSGFLNAAAPPPPPQAADNGKNNVANIPSIESQNPNIPPALQQHQPNPGLLGQQQQTDDGFDEQRAILSKVMNLTQQEIEQLSPEQRQYVLQLKELVTMNNPQMGPGGIQVQGPPQPQLPNSSNPLANPNQSLLDPQQQQQQAPPQMVVPQLGGTPGQPTPDQQQQQQPTPQQMAGPPFVMDPSAAIAAPGASLMAQPNQPRPPYR